MESHWSSSFFIIRKRQMLKYVGETLASGTASGSGRGGTASTQGGRRAQARGKKGKAKGGKIRQGEYWGRVREGSLRLPEGFPHRGL